MGKESVIMPICGIILGGALVMQIVECRLCLAPMMALPVAVGAKCNCVFKNISSIF